MSNLLHVNASEVEMITSSHDKFYRVMTVSGDPSGFFSVANWGRRGAVGQLKATVHPTLADAERASASLRRSKVNSGYQESIGRLIFNVSLPGLSTVKSSPMLRPLAEAFHREHMRQVWAPALRRLDAVVASDLDAPLTHVALVSETLLQSRSQEWAQHALEHLGTFPHFQHPTSDILAVSLPASVFSWFHTNWEVSSLINGVVLVSHSGATTSTLETWMGVYQPKGSGPMSSPDDSLEAAQMLSGAL